MRKHGKWHFGNGKRVIYSDTANFYYLIYLLSCFIQNKDTTNMYLFGGKRPPQENH